MSRLLSPNRRTLATPLALRGAAVLPALLLGLGTPGAAARSAPRDALVKNGWYQQDGRVIWGLYHSSSIWGGLRTPEPQWYSTGKVGGPNITRRDPTRVGPLLTEDLDALSDSLKRYGFPGLEHHYGLWYDRRRDAHDLGKRKDAAVVGPFLEMPWARSDVPGAADGLSKYDLTRFNPWYFERLREFARLSDAKGLVFRHNFYMQHMLLESRAHFEDFPWRPFNTIQDTGLPDTTPTANAFYDVSHPIRRDLHRRYIRKCLDELGGFRNVVFGLSQEYTGPKAFMEFWLDVIRQWQDDQGNQRKNVRRVHVSLGATKDVTDAILSDATRAPLIGTIDMSRWWYDRDGTLIAPQGGIEIPGRYIGMSGNTSPQQLYRQVREYRRRYPALALIHGASSRQQMWAFLMAGGSLIGAGFSYRDAVPPTPPYEPPTSYVPPTSWPAIRPMYELINTHLSAALLRMTPQDGVVATPEQAWALGEAGQAYLVYSLRGDTLTLDLPRSRGAFVARWFDPRSGALCAMKDLVAGGRRATVPSPSPAQDWVLWLDRAPQASGGSQSKGLAGLPTCSAIASVAAAEVVSVPDVPAPDSGVRSGAPSAERLRHKAGARLGINFQPADRDPPPGFVADTGETYGVRRGLRFGWSRDQSHRMLRRTQELPQRRPPDPLLDTVCNVGRDVIWEIDVDNGDYTVEVVTGDPVFPSHSTVTVEGVRYWDERSLYTNQFATLARTVTVSDGRLTVQAQGGEKHSTKLAYLTITAVGAP